MTAQDRGWGLPGSGPIRTIVRSDGLRLPVNTRVTDLVSMLIDLTEFGHGYDVRPGQTWGYAYRKISGTDTWSNHAWGLAVDINAPSNPYASADWHRRNNSRPQPFGLDIVCDMPEGMVRLWEDHGFRWGGRYRTKPDPMHFEFMGTPGDAAQILTRLRVFLGAAAPTPPAPKPPTRDPGDPIEMQVHQVREGDQGGVVGTLQSLLNGKGGADLIVDRDFGPATTEAVRRFQTWWKQHDKAIAVDGIAGAQVWGLLQF